MSHKLVFLHVPKTAGTAHRLLLFSNYGKSSVFWYMIDSNADKYIEAETNGYKIIGGHRPFQFYPSSAGPFLYTGVLREPIRRAVSHFYYIATGPDLAERKRLLAQGFDPKSLEFTLDRCPAFVNEIENMQVLYLTGTRKFEEAIQVIQRSPFILGVLDNYDDYLDYFASWLHWPKRNADRVYEAKQADYAASILDNESLYSRLSELNKEDEKLYQHVKQRRILLSAVSEDMGADLVVPNGWLPPTYSADEIKRVTLTCSTRRVSLVRDKDIYIDIELQNNCTRDLRSFHGEPPITIGTRFFASKNDSTWVNGCQTPLPSTVRSGERIVLSVRLCAPQVLPIGRYSLEISLRQDTLYWFASLSQSHSVTLDCDVISQ